MKESDLKERTKSFALRVIRLYVALPKRGEANVIGHQLLRSGTSVGAHNREACRAKSDADFISKIKGGLQELDESSYWLELPGDAGIMSATRIKPLHDESQELISIFVTMVKKTKYRKVNTKGN